MKRFLLAVALIGTAADAQGRVVCQRVFNTVQCNEYDAPQAQAQMPVYQQNPMIQQMLSPAAVNGFQAGQAQYRQRQLQAQIEAQNHQIDNCRYAAAHGFAC